MSNDANDCPAPTVNMTLICCVSEDSLDKFSIPSPLLKPTVHPHRCSHLFSLIGTFLRTVCFVLCFVDILFTLPLVVLQLTQLTPLSFLFVHGLWSPRIIFNIAPPNSPISWPVHVEEAESHISAYCVWCYQPYANKATVSIT